MNRPSVPFVDSQSAAPLPRSGLAWLDAARREHLDAFAARGLPDTRDENWRYTALHALAQRRYAVGDDEAAERPVAAASLAWPQAEGPRLVFVNGVYRADLSQHDDLPEGVSLRPLTRALHEDPEPLRFVLERRYREAGDAFDRLNAAFAADGAVLRVDAGVRVPAPVQLIFIGAPAATACTWHLRHVIELGEGSALTLIERHLGEDAGDYLATSVGDLRLGTGARLDHLQVQTAPGKATLIRRERLDLAADAQVRCHVLELGGALVRHDVQAILHGERARFDNRGVFAPHGRQHVDSELAIRHAGRETMSSSDWRGVAGARGRGVFRGSIIVDPGADGANAALTSKNLLLSAQAEIDTRPELEIYTDAVQAAHGATVGQLDERALFYLRARGVPLSQARSMLTEAFCAAMFADLEPADWRERLAALLAAHLRRGDET